MKNQSLVSVILPVYNGMRFLADAINSILAQSYSNLELLIVDDGSTDEIQSIVKTFATNDSRIRFFQQQNSGVATARNVALREAHGQYIGFIDQDDLWQPDKLEVQMMYFNNHPDCVFLHGNIDYIDDQSTSVDKSLYPWITNASGHCFEHLFTWNAIAIQTVCFKSECIKTVGFLREDVPGVDDYDYWLRFSRFFRIDYLDKTLALYRFHGDNESHKWHLQDIKRAKVLEGILQQFPEVYAEFGRVKVNEKLHALFCEIATEFVRKNAYDDASPYLLKALRISPFNLNNLKCFLLGFIPNKVRSNLRWYTQKIGISLR